ncbi:hypothetical protein F5Y03DRAFT_398185 [Xylaria venustula]|nr:hypothetical protein F5Y03DRAFT_398185 [Xylaria venustula]
MSSYLNTPDVMATIILSQAEAQLDGTTCVVKIPISMVVGLSQDSQSTIKQTVSAVLGHEVAFYLDSQRNNRVYLANLESIKRLRPCEARIVPGSPLPVLFWISEVTGVSSDGGIKQPNVRPLTQDPNISLPTPASHEKNSSERVREPECPRPSPKTQPEQGAPPRKKRKTKNGSPKAPNSYVLFKKDQRQILTKENPDITFGEVSKVTGAQWRNMTLEEQEPYKLRAEEAKAKKSGNGLLKRKREHFLPSDFQVVDDGLNIAQPAPQVDQASFPSTGHLPQPPTYMAPEHSPSQPHQTGSLSYNSVSSNSGPSSYMEPTYLAQSVECRNLESTNVNQLGQADHLQEFNAAGNFGLSLPHVPLDNNMAQNRFESRYPDITDPLTQTTEQPAENIALPSSELAPAMPREVPDAGADPAADSFLNFMDFSDVGVPSAGGIGQLHYDMAHIPGQEALGMPQAVPEVGGYFADDDFWKFVNFDLPPLAGATE